MIPGTPSGTSGANNPIRPKGKDRFSDSGALLKAFREALEVSNIVSVTDPFGTITYVNEEFCRVSGYSREELLGSNHRIIRHPDMGAEIFEDLWKTISSKKTWKGLIKNRKKDGSFYWVKTVIIPVLEADGEISEYVSVRTDVTDLEVSKERLAESLRNLEELDRRKSDFVNIASHELRTPATVIRGYASMIEETERGASDPEIRTYAEEILKSADRLIQLINDMLDLSKMEFENARFAGEKFDLRDLLRDVAVETSPLFLERKLSFEIETGPEPINIFGDASKLRRALLNIISNAAKFTPPGGAIVCETFETPTRKGICVRDTGVGIREDDFGKIFEKFGQGQNALTRETAGSGLGLSIAKEIVERSGGKIEVKSEMGKGSEFCILFP